MPTSSSAHVVVIGSSNTDLVLSCDRLPRPGETLLGGQFEQHHGGKGANQAVAAARARGQVIFIGARGNDDFGQAAALALKKEKIDIRRFVVRPKISSGIALILVGGPSRDNMIAVAKSANDTVTARDITAASTEIRRAGAVIAQLETPLPSVIAGAKLAKKHGIPFLLNPAPARDLPAALLKLVTILTPNESEATLLTGEKNPERAGRALVKKGCQNVIITLGAKGALHVTAQGAKHFPAPKVKPVDTVGAGDCFNGWLAVGVAEKLPLERAIPRALRAASLSVTRPGAQSSMPHRREVSA
ncbi:MAG: ribokinase [Verrucomicrobia bacterium Tous-C9LFEB]|nr:MAG: ribokinase [Verrucomicrobia bacterium Tous-C9LFEB]